MWIACGGPFAGIAHSYKINTPPVGAGYAREEAISPQTAQPCFGGPCS